MFDIAFISYNEPNADENWNKLKSRFPFARRTHGIKGIHNAHIAAATKCYTKMFWVVDGDSEILDTFNFESPKEVWEDCSYVYRARNPVNGLVYGNGGVKLLPTYDTINMQVGTIDMTTSISKHFSPVNIIASVTKFDVDPFNTWKSAFRESVKLSSKSINRQVSAETEERLETWCSVGNGDFGEWSIKGALLGKQYGCENATDPDALYKINEFDWLHNYFLSSK